MTAVAIAAERENDRVILRASRRESLWRGILRVPLLGKLLGANVILMAAALTGHLLLRDASAVAELAVLLLVSFAVTGALVWLALRPIAELEATANRVAAGDFSARVPASVIADRDVAGLADTMNRLLDRVTNDRALTQHLAGRSVRARDVEREAVARELRESLAQTLSGIGLQLSAAIARNSDSRVGEQLESTHELVRQLTDEMRSVAETLYPGTLEEFGLVNAIQALARRIARRSHVRVTVVADERNVAMSPVQAAALYRAADEALRNVEQHAQARHAQVRLSTNEDIVLEIEDDGRGVDMRVNDPLQAGLGLFSAKVVLALAGGELTVSSGAGLGTSVVARVPADVSPGRS